MIRPLELLIGLRYTRAKRRNHFISFISATSMIGVVLGVWALITVMSIMNGFHKDLRDRILSDRLPDCGRCLFHAHARRQRQ